MWETRGHYFMGVWAKKASVWTPNKKIQKRKANKELNVCLVSFADRFKTRCRNVTSQRSMITLTQNAHTRACQQTKVGMLWDVNYISPQILHLLTHERYRHTLPGSIWFWVSWIRIGLDPLRARPSTHRLVVTTPTCPKTQQPKIRNQWPTQITE